MRFYAVATAHYEGVPDHIVGEVVAYHDEGVGWTPLDVNCLGAVFRSRDELLADEYGRRVLKAWEARDDQAWDHDQALFDTEQEAQEILEAAGLWRDE